MDMEDIFLYKGQKYKITSLLSKPQESLTGRQRSALNSYQKKQSKSACCQGFFGLICENQSSVDGFCNSCYKKQHYSKGLNNFISEVFTVDNMDVSSLNILNYSQKECAFCSKKCTVSYPYCANCLSDVYGLAIRPSFIPGAGLGLFATRSFNRGESLGLEYQGTILSKEMYLAIKNSATTDSRSARKLDYIMEINGSMFIDASTENGGPIRYINEAPSDELRNSKWLLKSGKVTVKTLEAIKTGCEFYLDYSGEKYYESFKLPPNVTIDGLEQHEKICRHYIDMISANQRRKRTK
jgi:hypothetical protein